MYRTHLLTADPDLQAAHPWPMVDAAGQPLDFAARGEWPAKWIYLSAARTATPAVVAYRCRVDMAAETTVRLYVSADERYDLFLDGVRVGRGPERGDPRHWYYDAYDVPLAAGPHVLVARVWSLGLGPAPWSQVTVQHGFLLAPGDLALAEQFATGVAPWEGQVLPGYRFHGAGSTAWTSVEEMDGAAFPWGALSGEGEGWEAVAADRPARSSREASFVHTFEHPLFPGRLPALLAEERRVGTVRQVDAADDGPYLAEAALADEVAPWQAMLHGGEVVVPPRTRRRVLIDLGDYYNAYPQVIVSGGRGGEVRLAWAEALTVAPQGNEKGHRDEIAGKYFTARPDVFRPDGGEARAYQPLWWRAGRYLQLEVVAADAPMTLTYLGIEETRYPYQDEGSFQCDDHRVDGLLPLCARTVQCCAHESYMDCPYYEQQGWVGDMRVQMLISHVMHRDPRLIRRCIEYFGSTRDGEEIVFGRYPAPQRLWIPSFALWWVAMLGDYARWRGEADFIRRMMPAARGTLEALLAEVGEDGLARTPHGWNYTDWAEGWDAGEPPRSFEAPSAILNWQLVQILTSVAALEQWLDEPELAARWERRAGELAEASLAAFWRPAAGLFADDPGGHSYSEHAQCMAVLAGRLPEAVRGTLAITFPGNPSLVRTSLYYDFYTIEALRLLGRMDGAYARLAPYFRFKGRGFCTTPETADPARSDSHAWSAHPRYHAVASILGVRPASFGFATVEVAPQFGPLQWAAGAVPHPQGEIRVALERAGEHLHGTIVLPDGVTGVFRQGGRVVPLQPGAQQVG